MKKFSEIVEKNPFTVVVSTPQRHIAVSIIVMDKQCRFTIHAFNEWIRVVLDETKECF